MKHKIVEMRADRETCTLHVLSEDGNTREFEMITPVAEIALRRGNQTMQTAAGATISDTDIKCAEISVSLERARQEIGMSIRELCRRAEIGHRSYYKMLSGDVKLETVLSAANVFGHTLELVPEDTAPARYILQKSQKRGYLVATDTVENVVVRFKKGEFNGDQEITVLDDGEFDPVRLAEIAREIGEWLAVFHTDKVKK